MSPRAVDESLIRRAPRSKEDLLALLFDGLDWPQPPGRDLEDIPLLDYSPEELHLDPAAVARLTRIQQLPTLTDGQPFGVFILSFDGGKLPVGAVRRVVNRLVHKKRAGQHQPRSLWDLDDLIFFCQSDDGVGVLHVVAFRESAGLPVMKVISWNTRAPENRISLIATENLPGLAWPEADVDADEWRRRWTTAFTATYRQGIRTAAALAARMAEVAKTVKQEVLALYEVETAAGPLRTLYENVRENLRADLDLHGFADMYAQTMVYGLLTARISHPEDFDTDAVNAVLKFENPFLDALYTQFRRQGDEAFDVDEFGLSDLADLLAGVDIDQILADFGSEQRKEDPVVFFYEDFLAEYDPDQRRELGTYYTPIPVVRCIVRAVDHILRTDLALPDGVADRTTWAEYTERTGQPVPDGVEPEEPVIRMIDPAVGTGTFLLEWFRQGVRSAHGTRSAEDIEADLAGRSDALEISLSSYAVAQLKSSLELPPEIRGKQHLNIHLADTLSGRQPSQQAMFDDNPIAEEGRRADAVKFDTRHNVVIGNPPYLRVDQREGGGWITHPPDGGRSLFEDIHEPARKHTIFSHQASLYNLYVYFWRWAIWKAFEQTPAGPAVVGFITASSWLQGPGFLGLRQLVRELADDIYVIDLGGDNLGARTEENVFPIQTPVAITILVRPGTPDRRTAARARYHRINGSRSQKLQALEALDLATAPWEDAAPGLHAPFVPPTGGASWQDHPALIDLVPWQQPGCKFNRTWPIAPDPQLLEARWRRFVATIDPADRAKSFVTARTGRSIHTRVAGLPKLVDLPLRAPHRPIVRYAYRSFDRQWAFDDPRLAALERPVLWASMSDRQLFLLTKVTQVLGSGPAMTATTLVPDLDCFHGRGGKDVFPLYRDGAGTPNADPDMLHAITTAHRAVADDADEITPERLFAYIYGVLAGADYTIRYSEELDTPGPRVPLSADPALFARVADHGEHLLWLQTYGERFRSSARQEIPIPAPIKWSREPSRIPTDAKDLSYDAASETLRVADGRLAGVSAEVWAFEVSGMPIVKKWLGYRTAKGSGRAASSDSPLDQIRPKEWSSEWSRELVELVAVLQQTLDLLPAGIDLLDEVCAGPLISASDLPEPPAHLRQPPAVDRFRDGTLDL